MGVSTRKQTNFMFHISDHSIILYSSPKLSSTMSSTYSMPKSPTSPFFHLVLFPLALMDLLVQVLLFIYTMTFQVSLYLIYIGLFIVCHATGHVHKLEKTGDHPSTRLKQKKNEKVEVVGENESGYFTDDDVKNDE